VDAFYIDKYPVTCTQFAAFIQDHSYTARDPTNFLKNWNGSSTAPAGFEKKPVTYVSLADARAYCSAYGKRLPHSWEWQVRRYWYLHSA
jgi:formylglycine-generating enzyme required for sulfatase activity